MGMHHHGADGTCHAGPGGLFGCSLCEPEEETEVFDPETDGDQDDGSDGPRLSLVERAALADPVVRAAVKAAKEGDPSDLRTRLRRV